MGLLLNGKVDVNNGILMANFIEKMVLLLNGLLELNNGVLMGNLYEQTGVKPSVALERQNGGASEMHRLEDTNDGFYTIYYGYDEDGDRKDKPGWDTNEKTRAQMLGDWLKAFNNDLILIYDQDTIEQHQSFIVGKNGKPQGDSNAHDDAVMSCAIAYQLMLTENPVVQKVRTKERPRRSKLHV